MSKIQKNHLDRAAFVYVRQSSPAQVEQNLESQRRQYGLVERAKELGWRDVRVIDEDGQEIEIRELDEDAFRTTESLGIDLSRPERGTDEEDERRREGATF